MVELSRIVDQYFELWNGSTAGPSGQLLSQVWAPDGRYADPTGSAVGHAEFARLVAKVRQAYPGCVYRCDGPIDEHDMWARFHWSMAGPDGTVLVRGVDFVERSADGRLATLIGFFDQVSVAASVVPASA